eukprot:UN10856
MRKEDKVFWFLARQDCWRYDIGKNKWYIQPSYGNCPVYRAESGYTSTNNNGVVIFGGYNSTLISNFGSTGTGRRFIYFSDCFEFSSKTEQWKMIQSGIYPFHRARPGLVRLNNFIVLYGGYHGGDQDQPKIFNDLWILDMNKLKTRNNKLKVCQPNICDKTSNEM